MIGKKIADVEGSRNSPLRWYGDVVRVGVDFAMDSERAGDARMELVHFLRCVALGTEPDHDHAPLLKLVRAAVGIGSGFDFGVVGRDPFVDALV